MAGKRRDRIGPGMWLVIASKAITSALLLGACVLLLIAGKNEPQDVFSKFVSVLFKGNPPDIAISFVVSQTAFLTATKAYRLAAATLAYAILEGVEATGLTLRKPWAEWLTILVTASLLPFEVYELAKEPSALKAAMLALNVVILVFLIVRRLQERRRLGLRRPFVFRLAT